VCPSPERTQHSINLTSICPFMTHSSSNTRLDRNKATSSIVYLSPAPTFLLSSTSDVSWQLQPSCRPDVTNICCTEHGSVSGTRTNYTKWDFRFWRWRWQSSRILHRIVTQKLTDVSVCRCDLRLDCHCPDDGGSKHLRNIGHLIPQYIVHIQKDCQGMTRAWLESSGRTDVT
jgi:hypothetical protein